MMLRYVPRLIPPGSAPDGALIEPLIENPPTSPLGEHELIPQVAWMVERDGTFVHVSDSERAQLDLMRGSAELTKLEGELSNESLDALPGINLATNGEYAAELLLSMMTGLDFDRQHFGVPHRASAKARGRWAGFAVDAFLRAFAPATPDHESPAPAVPGRRLRSLPTPSPTSRKRNGASP